MENKITEEELKTIQEQQKKINEILGNVGVLESQKHALLHEIASVNEEVEKTKKELENKYGTVSINMETGVYKEIEQEEEETPVAAV